MAAIIHVGSVKTGSTSLQNFLYSNHETLRSNGIIYPLPITEIAEHKGNGTLLRRGVGGRDFRTMSESEDDANFIFSDEGMFPDFRYIINDNFKDVDFTVIAYIRDPVDLICAWTAEFMKPYNIYGDGIMELKSTFKLCSDRYSGILYGFIDSCNNIGWNNVIIRSYNKNNLYNSDVIEDFFNSIPLFENFDVSELYTSQDKIKNKTPEFKYCYLSQNIYEKLRKYDRLDLYSTDLVDYSYQFCRTGSSCSIRDTLSGEEKSIIYERFLPIYSLISENAGISSILDTIYANQENYSDNKSIDMVNEIEVDTVLLIAIAANRIGISVEELNRNFGSSIQNIDYLISQIDFSITEVKSKTQNLFNLRGELLNMQNTVNVLQSNIHISHS